MAPRSTWKGAIQLGLVTIPVKLYAATDSAVSLGFNMLHKTDLSRIQMKVYCPVENAIIERSDTVKGYEHAPDQYVVIDENDLAQLALPSIKAVEIRQFVKRDTPITRFTEKAYYVAPEPVGRKAYALLRTVLVAKGLTAIAKIVLRDREDLCSISVMDNALVLSTLKWPDEIRDSSGLGIGEEPTVSPAERKMAEQLVASMTAEFDPAQYVDEYRAAMLKIIEAKIDGTAPTATVAAPAAPAIDLMAALQASLAAKS